MNQPESDQCFQQPDRERVLALVPWKIRDVAIASAIPFGFIIIALVAGLVVDVGDAVEADATIPPWAIFIFQAVLLGLAWFFGIRKYNVPWSTLGLRPSKGRWGPLLPWAALLASLAVTLVYAQIVTLIGADFLEPRQEIGAALGEGRTLILNTLVIGVWGPFTEEIFFRGFVLAAMLPVMGPIKAMILSAGIFAFAHFDIGILIPIFVTGLLLAWLYIKTKSLWPPITAHAAQNLLALALSTQALK